jgi:predicted TIM-barrel fold metal-dependent hydrolase
MIIDIHNHIGTRPGAQQSAEDLLRKMDGLKIDMCVIFPQTRTNENHLVLEANRRYPDRLIGLVAVNPWNPHAVRDIRENVERGAKGLKMHPYVDSYPLDNHQLTDPIFRLAEELELPILCHGSGDNPYSMPQQFAEMARTFPKVTIIMGHTGAIWAVDAAVREGARFPNLFLETSTTLTCHVEAALREAGPTKVLMGTDSPFNSHAVELKKIEVCTTDPNVRNLVMGENAARIFLKTGRPV